MKDKSLHIKKDGRVYKMYDDMWDAIPFKDGKHNYTKKDYDSLQVGGWINFVPKYGNEKSIETIMKRIK